jgi:hypothetical protein
LKGLVDISLTERILVKNGLAACPRCSLAGVNPSFADGMRSDGLRAINYWVRNISANSG